MRSRAPLEQLGVRAVHARRLRAFKDDAPDPPGAKEKLSHADYIHHDGPPKP
jgi:hypothetical protein